MSDRTPVVAPREDVNDETVCVARWLATDGSRVRKGDPIVEIETSKVDFEISAPASGFLRHARQEHQEVEIGSVLGYICDTVDADLASGSAEPGAVTDSSPAAHASPAHLGSGGPGRLPSLQAAGGRARFTQPAAQLMKEWGLDPSRFQNAGVVRSQDVLNYIREQGLRKPEGPGSMPPAGELRIPPIPAAGVAVHEEKLSRSKRLEARYLWSARHNTLPSSVTVRCHASPLHEAAERHTGIRANIAAVILAEVARLLRKYPVFNAYYAADCINYYEAVNVGFAIDAGRGLKVPVIRDADKKSIAEIAGEMRERLVQYLDDQLSPQSLSAGTFTITDLSGEDVYSFQPLLNQGQSAILAVCSEFQPAGGADPLLNLVMVFDHQLSEGRQAARFLNELRIRLEEVRRENNDDAHARAASDTKPPLAQPRNAVEQKLAGIWCDVFRLESVGVHDNFLELGGHSLLAAELLLRVKKAFQVDLPLHSLFDAPSIAGISALIQQRKGRASEAISLPAVISAPEDRYQPFPLTDIQQAYWVGRGNSFELGNVGCHIYSEVDFPDFDQSRFEFAIQHLIGRHDMLRAIVRVDGTQQVLQEVPVYRLEVSDLRGLSPEQARRRCEAVRDGMSHEVLQPDRWPLFHIKASLLEDRRALLHISLDLLVLDARSIQILVEEFSALYRKSQASLAPLQLSFRDYVQTQAALQDSEAYRRSEAYWRSRLSSLLPGPDLPLAKNPGLVKNPRFVRRSARLDPEVWSRLKIRAREEGLTAPALLLAAYAEILALWTSSPQFTLNLTLFNRLPVHAQVNDIVGDFTSLAMLAVDHSQPDNFADRARRIQQQLWSDLDHRYFSGIRVLRELARAQGASTNVAMPVVFTSFLNLDTLGREVSERALGTITYGVTQTPQVWLDNLVREEAGALVINWDAVQELFPPGLLDDMFGAYYLLLLQLASDHSAWTRLARDAGNALLPSVQHGLFEQVNQTAAPVAADLLYGPFLQQVHQRPNALAIVTPRRRLTYSQVYERACGVEAQLLQRRAQPNQLIAVMMEKGWEQVVAVLGIQFAGAAYLPVDPDLPAERQRYLLDHGQVRIVITQAAVQDRLSMPPGVEVLVVDAIGPVHGVAPAPRGRQRPEDLAYVIYTSGSTGVPKGVMIDHRGALNTILDLNQRFGVGSQDRVLALSRLSFDLSVYDIFGLLAAGGAVVMPAPDHVQDPENWAELLVSEKVTLWNTVPALMQLLIEQAGERIGRSLRLVMMSGDWIPVALPEQIRRLVPNAKIISLGGATEASIWSILYAIETVDPEWKSIPYGRPMLNQGFHVLRDNLAPCPIWVPGHLYISGIGLAKGYWRDEQKTAASFITHPDTGDRLYRTGDLGRYLPDGNIEFLGRDDFQVKIRGHRIELGEIEVCLGQHDAVDTSVVVVREPGPPEKLLVAYAVLKPGKNATSVDLRDHLRARLPEYMVPSAFVFLDRLPLTSNGKVNRKALPEPAVFKPEPVVRPAARDALDLQLIKIWETVLNAPSVGITDDFFDLGGHSLIALRLFAEIRKLTGRNLPLSTLFTAPTVEKLADLLRKDGSAPKWSSLVPIEPGNGKPPFYCVHGAGGNVVLFRDLARYLGADYPFYGIQAHGLDGSADYLRSVEEMASYYLKEIRQAQPVGPYYLGGFCLGGLVAFEMAHRLRNEGQQVALLALIDSYNYNGVPPRLSWKQSMTHTREKVAFHSLNLLRLSIRDQISYLRKKIEFASSREIERLLVRLSNLLKRAPVGHRLSKSEVILEYLNEEAGFAYVPSPYTEKVTLFKPKRTYSHLRDPQLGWGAMTPGGLSLVEIPVEPGGLFVEPYVQLLAEKLRVAIDEARLLHGNQEADHSLSYLYVHGVELGTRLSR